MTEKLKYKVGDKVLIEAEFAKVDDTNVPYLLGVPSGYFLGWISEEALERNTCNLPPRPKVTQAVMDWYEENEVERADWNIFAWLDWKWMPSSIREWIVSDNRLQKEHALATLITYGPEAVEVEKEKVYKVYVTVGGKSFSQLKQDSGSFFFGSTAHDSTTFKTTFTESELENMGLGEVFSCNIFKVEEVE